MSLNREECISDLSELQDLNEARPQRTGGPLPSLRVRLATHTEWSYSQAQSGIEDDMRTGIGLDPSLTGLAICCIAEDGSVRETVLPPSKPSSKTVGGRIGRYRDHVNAAVGWLQQHAEPGPLIIEGYSFGSKGTLAFQSGEFGCYLRTKLLACGYLVIEASPNTLKKFATGKGKGDKCAIASSLANRYRREFANDNEADAFGLAKLCACMIGIEEPQTAPQRETVADMRANMEAERSARPW